MCYGHFVGLMFVVLCKTDQCHIKIFLWCLSIAVLHKNLFQLSGGFAVILTTTITMTTTTTITITITITITMIIMLTTPTNHSSGTHWMWQVQVSSWYVHSLPLVGIVSHFYGLVQDCGISSSFAMEILQSSICFPYRHKHVFVKHQCIQWGCF